MCQVIFIICGEIYLPEFQIAAFQERQVDTDQILLPMEAKQSRASQIREECLERDGEEFAGAAQRGGGDTVW